MAPDKIEFRDEVTFEGIYAAATRPRYYGKRYRIADSEEKLILVLGEACCISAFSLVQILQLPRRGRLVLAIFKTLFPKKYKSHQFLYNFSYSHCLIYVSRKLKDIFKRNLTEMAAEDISENAYSYGGSYFVFSNKYSKEDKEALLKEMEQRIYDYKETVEEKALLENLHNGLGRELSATQISMFFKETIENDPLRFVEPFRFIERLKEIRGSNRGH